MKRIVLLISAVLMLAACKRDNSQQQADALLTQANAHFEQGRYAEALSAIDSLRKVYPNAIDTRKKALRLYQEIELTGQDRQSAATGEPRLRLSESKGGKGQG